MRKTEKEREKRVHQLLSFWMSEPDRSRKGRPFAWLALAIICVAVVAGAIVFDLDTGAVVLLVAVVVVVVILHELVRALRSIGTALTRLAAHHLSLVAFSAWFLIPTVVRDRGRRGCRLVRPGEVRTIAGGQRPGKPGGGPPRRHGGHPGSRPGADRPPGATRPGLSGQPLLPRIAWRRRRWNSAHRSRRPWPASRSPSMPD